MKNCRVKVIVFKYGEDEWRYKRVPMYCVSRVWVPRYCVSKVWGDALKVSDESNITGESLQERYGF